MTTGSLRVGIVGAGVSGMTAAWLLQHDHQVTLFDRAPAAGGHVETVTVHTANATVHAELGPRFFFDGAYPCFLALLRVLDVPTRWTAARVSFTDVTDHHTVVLPPRGPRQVAALLRSPRRVRHALSLRRLIAQQPGVAARRDFSVTLRQHLADHGYPPGFGPEFIYPFLAACWGAPLDLLPDFPAYSLLKGMPPGRAPGFLEVPGGMGRYVRALQAELTRVDLRLGLGVQAVEHRDGFVLVDDHGTRTPVDRLIVATSARDAAGLLAQVPLAAPLRALVAGFRHFDTEIVVHGDPAFMPRHRGDWSHNNLFFNRTTAWMSDWQGLRDNALVIRTWLPRGHPEPRSVYARRSFHHLVLAPENAVLQQRIAAVQGAAGLWVTGMYAVDVDNHESALLSALVPACALAPRSPTLRRLMDAAGPDAAHALGVLPVPPPAVSPGEGGLRARVTHDPTA